MKILIIVSEMISLTGSPLYHYTLAIELKLKGHDVDIYSRFGNNELRVNMSNLGINLLSDIDKNLKYDIVFISQPLFKDKLDCVNSDCIINICHSEYDCESPIKDKKIFKYVAIRPSIKEHLIKEHGILADKIEVIYNGVDFKRFNPQKRIKHRGNYTKVVLPCPIHDLREKFIRYYTDKANKQYRVFIYGKNYIVDFEKTINEYVTILPSVFDIENYIGDADLIAGILLGRVNLEAYAMGIKSYIHNPENVNEFKEFNYLDNKQFKNRHDIVNVADKLIQLYMDDITCKNIGFADKKEEIFSTYYNTNHWGDKESVSGTGSNLQQTETIRREIPIVLQKFNIKSMLDIPCGDFYWMSRIDLSEINYIGADIVKDLIKSNIENHKDKEFRVLDVTKDDLPKVDLIFCRDCLVHFSYKDIFDAMLNFKKSGSRYLLTTSFNRRANNYDIDTGKWRPLNLETTPFNMKPLYWFCENCTEDKGAFADKFMLLYELNK